VFISQRVSPIGVNKVGRVKPKRAVIDDEKKLSHVRSYGRLMERMMTQTTKIYDPKPKIAEASVIDKSGLKSYFVKMPHLQSPPSLRSLEELKIQSVTVDPSLQDPFAKINYPMIPTHKGQSRSPEESIGQRYD